MTMSPADTLIGALPSIATQHGSPLATMWNSAMHSESGAKIGRIRSAAGEIADQGAEKRAVKNTALVRRMTRNASESTSIGPPFVAAVVGRPFFLSSVRLPGV